MTMKLSVILLLVSSLLILSPFGENASEPYSLRANGEPEPPRTASEPYPPDVTGEPEPPHGDVRTTYIVYMGDAASPVNRNNHGILMSSMLQRKSNEVLHSYKNGFLGFAARLSDTEAASLAKHPGVVSVFPDTVYQLHTTRSWDFLKDKDTHISKYFDSLSPRSISTSSTSASDTIIGILDTGIWPESESFNDHDLDPIPSRWKGTCVEGKDFNSSQCNKKLIGARYYGMAYTARDSYGHGTHVASTAAGTSVGNASYYGLAPGTSKGGSPSSRIAMYRVCSGFGCSGSAILAAFNDAIADGVDLLSLSIGGGGDYWNDTIAIGAFHAVQRGITVICSAGNGGPDNTTVENVAPWIITVAATTIDRDLQSNVVLGNNLEIEGGGINFSELGDSPVYPLITGLSAKSGFGTAEDARKCDSESLDPAMINGTIVVCQLESDSSDSTALKSMSLGLKPSGALGRIYIGDECRLVAEPTGFYPLTCISSKDGDKIFEYINSTRYPTATILPTKTVFGYKPAPTVGAFSSRGPSYTTKHILKPDIAAPGVSILAAWRGNDTSPGTTPPSWEPPQFNILSGTSMACPHVSGVVANIKSQNPTWSPAAIRSAIMTTAIQTNNVGQLITTETGQVATPYDIGAGEVNPTGGLQPGLIYELDPEDHLLFLCYYGYDLEKIKLISATLPFGFSCPENSTRDMISNINYPSIAVVKDVVETPVTVTRTVTNVGSVKEMTVYTVSVVAPEGLEVKVMPSELKFVEGTNKLSYEVTFSAFSGASVKGDMFGAIIWSNQEYTVRSPFVVSIP